MKVTKYRDTNLYNKAIVISLLFPLAGLVWSPILYLYAGFLAVALVFKFCLWGGDMPYLVTSTPAKTFAMYISDIIASLVALYVSGVPLALGLLIANIIGNLTSDSLEEMYKSWENSSEESN